MSGLPVIAYPPSPTSGRRVRVDGEILGLVTMVISRSRRPDLAAKPGPVKSDDRQMTGRSTGEPPLATGGSAPATSTSGP
ncbi:hypothetical protein [Streptomyces sp. NPDC001820]|uniref:hypothetical protein n=1 Tax=Streptomyces sp. NPDC001820 TaxID=3364613 RepID=UPI003676933A